MAASLLVNCLSGLNAEEKAAAMDEMLRTIVARQIPVLVQAAEVLGTQEMAPQLSLLAAILSCKKGERTSEQTVDALVNAFAEIQAAPFSFAPFFHNLFVAANLML
jgi:hypothetical protein